LQPWNAELAQRGAIVTLLRLELMETFSLTLAEEIRALGEKWAEVQIEYQRGGSARDREGIQWEMVGALEQATNRDVLLQSTSVGPHRDDWQMMADGHALKTFASRGQQRTAVLALLFLEASYLELRRGEKPLILLDDIFSELDLNHRKRVTEAFSDHQVIMSATEAPEGVEAEVWRVGEGNVGRMTNGTMTQ
jgi:DNA replication and repair protein RecF